jgi:hypothetical protein
LHFISTASISLFWVSSQKRGERPEGLSGSTMFFDEAFGTVFHHPQNIEKILFYRIKTDLHVRLELQPTCNYQM